VNASTAPVKRPSAPAPAQQGQCTGGNDQYVESAEGHRQPAGIFAHQPVARKTRNDAPPDQRDQQYDDGGADSGPDVRSPVKMGNEVKRDIAGE